MLCWQSKSIRQPWFFLLPLLDRRDRSFHLAVVVFAFHVVPRILAAILAVVVVIAVVAMVVMRGRVTAVVAVIVVMLMRHLPVVTAGMGESAMRPEAQCEERAVRRQGSENPSSLHLTLLSRRSLADCRRWV
jgi:hypothetical protein